MRRLNANAVAHYLALGAQTKTLARGRELLAWSTAVEQLLPDSHRAHCRVANVRNHTLVLLADSPAWAARLRFHAPTILRKLELDHKLSLRRVQIRVDPEAVRAPRRRVRRTGLSTHSGHLLRQAAQAVEDPQLKAALERLARRASS